MSRLISADALERAVMFLGEDSICNDCAYEFVSLIDEQPTVEAIPIDWILQRMNETSSGLGMNIELNYALFTVGVEWERWKKEHGMEEKE